MTETDNQIEAAGLSCVRNDRLLFDDLGFSLRSGEVLQVSGTNGSGKSSLLRIVCGLLLPEEGEVRWNGQDIRQERQEYLQQLTYLGHLHGIKDDLTVTENVVFNIALAGSQQSDDRIHDVLQRLKLDSHAETLTRKLSAGQKRRLALSRFMLTDSVVWILDEPFTALDEEGKKLACDLIGAHVSSGGLCMVATHEALQLQDGNIIGLDL